MSRGRIFTIYIFIDLLIVAGVLWCVSRHVAAAKYLLVAGLLFALNGLWLVVMTVRKTPPRS
ncbi:MAG TPA: hypothetical protein VHA06_01675 [Candidatus Angelobacter sp.]|nr:hypothetical protein [Candidatus Angelobacter sp.]